MESTDIRQLFLDFFKEKTHHILPGVPILNQADPELLFVNSGMNPFKHIFLGKEKAPYPTIANAQPCLRVSGKHNDLEDVGQDTYHHTLFEMLGSWSFGQYGKKEAIRYAWELLVNRYQLSKADLYVTVFEGDDTVERDDESANYWKAWIDPTHILYASKKDNFWEMGQTGPCGPCTEIHIDLRSEEARAKQPAIELINKDHPEVIEIWNLVFIQFYRAEDQSLKRLKQTYVDTGMGFERLTMAIQGKKSTYDTDIFRPIIQALEEASGMVYGSDPSKDKAFQVISDHIRAIFFGIADGVLPGAQKEGYVIRRILRRAVRYGYTFLGFKNPFLYRLIPSVQKKLGAIYPRLKKQTHFSQEIIKQEEKNFLRTLEAGIKRLQSLVEQQPKEVPSLPGEHIFELYDTYGFPLDLTALILSEEGLQVDHKGFQEAMAQQKNRSKEDLNYRFGDWITLKSSEKISFVGYKKLETESKLLQYRDCSKKETRFYQLVFEQTPFYPEGGGQVGDTGYLLDTENGEKIAIWDTKRLYGQIVHYTYQLPTVLSNTFHLVVNQVRRHAISKNHTATHLLQAALQTILKLPIQQKGSLVEESLLRFDFSYPKKIAAADLRAIEDLIQQKIENNIAQEANNNLTLAEAKAAGATALFTEKYGDRVRMVTFEAGFSRELCQGTHVAHTSEIGLFKIMSEQSVASGVRRIVARTGSAAYLWIQDQLEALKEVQKILNQPKSIVQGVQDLLTQRQELKKNLSFFYKKALKDSEERLRSILTKQKTPPYHLIEEVALGHPENLRNLVFQLKKAFPTLKAILVTVHANQVYLIVHLPEKEGEKQEAGVLIQQLLPIIEGRGGGNKHIAFGTGKLIKKIPDLLKKARALLK